MCGDERLILVNERKGFYSRRRYATGQGMYYFGKATEGQCWYVSIEGGQMFKLGYRHLYIVEMVSFAWPTR